MCRYFHFAFRKLIEALAALARLLSPASLPEQACETGTPVEADLDANAFMKQAIVVVIVSSAVSKSSCCAAFNIPAAL